MDKFPVRHPRQSVGPGHVRVIAGQRKDKVRVAHESPIGQITRFKTSIAHIQIKLPILRRPVGRIDKRNIPAVVADQKTLCRGIEAHREPSQRVPRGLCVPPVAETVSQAEVLTRLQLSAVDPMFVIVEVTEFSVYRHSPRGPNDVNPTGGVTTRCSDGGKRRALIRFVLMVPQPVQRS